MKTIGRNLLTPPNNVGPRSTPDYASLVAPAIHSFKDGTKVFAGQRDDPFFVDLGGTFDLLGFRSAPPGAFETGGVDGLRGYSRQHDRDPGADQAPDPHQVGADEHQQHQLGGRRLRDRLAPGDRPQEGHRPLAAGLAPRQPAHQRGRHPARARRTSGTAAPRPTTSSSRSYYLKPELAGILNLLYDLGAPTENRIDLTTILLTGIPPNNGLGLPTTQIGNKPVTADLLRVNLAAPPTAVRRPEPARPAVRPG